MTRIITLGTPLNIKNTITLTTNTVSLNNLRNWKIIEYTLTEYSNNKPSVVDKIIFNQAGNINRYQQKNS